MTNSLPYVVDDAVYQAFKENWCYPTCSLARNDYANKGKQLLEIYNTYPGYAEQLYSRLRMIYPNEYVLLYRGMRAPQTDTAFYNKFKKKRKGSKMRLGAYKSCSPASWTDQYTHAQYFAYTNLTSWQSIIFEAQIPISKIIFAVRAFLHHLRWYEQFDDYVIHEFVVDHTGGLPCKIIHKRLHNWKHITEK